MNRTESYETIRAATPDDAPEVAALMILSMGHIAGIFANSDRYEDAIPFFETFFRDDNNQYSYANTLVYEDETGLAGSITGYDGARLHELREPILNELWKTQPGFSPGDETETGEYYLDCISVKPDRQGKGIGKKLISAFCGHAAALGFERVGLIVDQANPDARRLYAGQGFEWMGERDFMGHRYDHLVKILTKNV
ncbi:GNAT family N-acetyltransferase [Dyadobacter helix]|nr:N-acetyltransferase [Dyadobacter sp. CECT 9275]